MLIFIIIIGEYKRKCYIAPINKQGLPKRIFSSSKCPTNSKCPAHIQSVQQTLENKTKLFSFQERDEWEAFIFLPPKNYRRGLTST